MMFKKLFHKFLCCINIHKINADDTFCIHCKLPTYNALLSTTLWAYHKKINDNISKGNAVLAALRREDKNG